MELCASDMPKTTHGGAPGTHHVASTALPLVTDGIRQVWPWNQTQSDYPRELCLRQLLEDQSRRTPDSVAVECQGRALSYAELDARSNQLAHYLRQRGVHPEHLVGVFLERSVEMVVALLGILKAGGAYVPLDPAYPGERIRYVLEDAHVKLLLTQNSLLESLPSAAAQVICLD